MMVKRGLLFVFGGIVLVAGFQNCSPNVAFTKNEMEGAALESGELTVPDSDNPSPIVTMPPIGDVICDPFTNNSSCPSNGQGLMGHIYYLEESQAHLFGGSLRNTKVQDYFDHGTKVETPLLLSQLNVSPRDWSTGFPTAEGMIKNSKGEALFEWFAFDLKGYIHLDKASANTKVEVQLAVLSDDGTVVSIDNNMLIDNDAIHAPKWKCARASVILDQQKRPLRVQYFQGPRYQIALQLMWRPWSDKDKSCDQNGGFLPVPKEMLSH